MQFLFCSDRTITGSGFGTKVFYTGKYIGIVERFLVAGIITGIMGIIVASEYFFPLQEADNYQWWLGVAWEYGFMTIFLLSFVIGCFELVARSLMLIGHLLVASDTARPDIWRSARQKFLGFFFWSNRKTAGRGIAFVVFYIGKIIGIMERIAFTSIAVAIAAFRVFAMIIVGPSVLLESTYHFTELGILWSGFELITRILMYTGNWLASKNVEYPFQ